MSWTQWAQMSWTQWAQMSWTQWAHGKVSAKPICCSKPKGKHTAADAVLGTHAIICCSKPGGQANGSRRTVRHLHDCLWAPDACRSTGAGRVAGRAVVAASANISRRRAHASCQEHVTASCQGQACASCVQFTYPSKGQPSAAWGRRAPA